MADETRLSKLLEVLGSPNDVGMVEFALEVTESMVLSYINHETLPAALETPLIAMAAAYYKSAALGSTDNGEGAVTAIKRGDTQVSYAAGASPSANTFDLVNGDALAGWRTLLNPYRKLRW